MEVQRADACKRCRQLHAPAAPIQPDAAAAASANAAATPAAQHQRQCHRQAADNAANHGAVDAPAVRPVGTALDGRAAAANDAAPNVQPFGGRAEYAARADEQQRRPAHHPDDAVADARPRHVRSDACAHEQRRPHGQAGPAAVAAVAAAAAEHAAATESVFAESQLGGHGKIPQSSCFNCVNLCDSSGRAFSSSRAMHGVVSEYASMRALFADRRLAIPNGMVASTLAGRANRPV